MEFRTASIAGCYHITPQVFRDQRGFFVKTFNAEIFAEHRLETKFPESYFSVSHQGVIRGLHFQIPPADHVKLVSCLQGEILDVVVDLRVGSPTYREHDSVVLSAEQGNVIYIPPGLAHGFCVISERASTMYQTSTVYAAEYDSGVLWNSANIKWPTDSPILSQRDSSFVSLNEFESPFVYQAGADRG